LADRDGSADLVGNDEVFDKNGVVLNSIGFIPDLDFLGNGFAWIDFKLESGRDGGSGGGGLGKSGGNRGEG